MSNATPRPSRAGRSRRPNTQSVLRLESLGRPHFAQYRRADPGFRASAPYASGDILVQFRTTNPPSFNVSGAVLGQSLSLVPGLYEVDLQGLSVANAVAAFQANPNVVSAEPDYLVASAGTPNDPFFSQQWGLQNTGQSGGLAGVDIKAVQAWGVTTSASNVIVSLIDTGVDYNNSDLYQNIWINQAEIPTWWYTKSSDGKFDKVVYKSQIVTATPGVITFADLNNAVNKGLVWDTNGDGRVDAGDLLRPLSQGGWDNNGQDAKDGDTAHPDDFFGWNFVANNNNPFDDNATAQTSPASSVPRATTASVWPAWTGRSNCRPSRLSIPMAFPRLSTSLRPSAIPWRMERNYRTIAGIILRRIPPSKTLLPAPKPPDRSL